MLKVWNWPSLLLQLNSHTYKETRDRGPVLPSRYRKVWGRGEEDNHSMTNHDSVLILAQTPGDAGNYAPPVNKQETCMHQFLVMGQGTWGKQLARKRVWSPLFWGSLPMSRLCAFCVLRQCIRVGTHSSQKGRERNKKGPRFQYPFTGPQWPNFLPPTLPLRYPPPHNSTTGRELSLQHMGLWGYSKSKLLYKLHSWIRCQFSLVWNEGPTQFLSYPLEDVWEHRQFCNLHREQRKKNYCK